MRVFYTLILLVFLGATAIFALQNREMVTIQYLDRNVSCELSLLIGVVYLLGMLTGWTIVGLLRRSIHRVSEQRAK
jgi:lipopolysaccharide assembly protein A